MVIGWRYSLGWRHRLDLAIAQIAEMNFMSATIHVCLLNLLDYQIFYFGE